MSGNISVTFEKDNLNQANKVRVITRIIDQGDVPPSPSSTYFPTDPSSLKYCIVGEVIASGNEERFSRIATLADFAPIALETLNYFEDASVDFNALGILTSDTLEIAHTYPEYWTSEEFPGTRFLFSISEVAPGGDHTRLRVGENFPSSMPNLSWQILRDGVSIVTNNTGITKWSKLATGTFRTHRFNSYFNDSVEADNFVAATKAQIQSLANASFEDIFIDETLTFNPIA